MRASSAARGSSMYALAGMDPASPSSPRAAAPSSRSGTRPQTRLMADLLSFQPQYHLAAGVDDEPLAGDPFAHAAAPPDRSPRLQPPAHHDPPPPHRDGEPA